MTTSNSVTALFAIVMALLILAAITVVPDHLNGSREVQAEYSGFRQLFSNDSASNEGFNDASLALPTMPGSSQ